MDFGLSRFLEMFEERFGPRLTTVLIAIIALAVVAVCVSMITRELIMPLVDLAKQANESYGQTFKETYWPIINRIPEVILTYGGGLLIVKSSLDFLAIHNPKARLIRDKLREFQFSLLRKSPKSKVVLPTPKDPQA